MAAAALVVGMVACCNRHDTDALAACYAPDARVHPAGWPQAVDARTRLATFGVILATFPDLRLHPRNLAAAAGWRSASDWYSALRRCKRKVRVSALRSGQTGSTILKTGPAGGRRRRPPSAGSTIGPGASKTNPRY
jgi:hypothetical protein